MSMVWRDDSDEEVWALRQHVSQRATRTETQQVISSSMQSRSRNINEADDEAVDHPEKYVGRTDRLMMRAYPFGKND